MSLDNVPNLGLFIVSLSILLTCGGSLIMAVVYMIRERNTGVLVAIPALLYGFVLYLYSVAGELQGQLPSNRLAYRADTLIFSLSYFMLFLTFFLAQRKRE